MDFEVVNGIYKTNLETVKAFVELFSSEQRHEIQDLKAELSDVRRSLEFSQA